MKIINKTINSYANNSYLKIETSGLSRDKDQIISIGILEKNTNLIKNYTIENLKDEEKLISNIVSTIENREFITYSGKSFDEPFINEKSNFYFSENINTRFIDIKEIVKQFNYLFNLKSYSIKNLLLYFNICNKDEIIEGIKNHIYFKNFVEGKIKNLDKVSENNIQNIIYLIKLYDKVLETIKEKLSFNIFNYLFTIDEIKLKKNILEIRGKSNFNEKYYISNKFYTLFLEKNFSLKINTMDLPYDVKDKCYFVMRKDYGNLKNISSLKSPDKILILYYKNYIFENIMSLTNYIIEDEIKKTIKKDCN